MLSVRISVNKNLTVPTCSVALLRAPKIAGRFRDLLNKEVP
jgi:hypothetical protein